MCPRPQASAPPLTICMHVQKLPPFDQHGGGELLHHKAARSIFSSRSAHGLDVSTAQQRASVFQTAAAAAVWGVSMPILIGGR